MVRAGIRDGGAGQEEPERHGQGGWEPDDGPSNSSGVKEASKVSLD